MAILLHLSDLHLAASANDDMLNDAKIDVISRRSQQNAIDRIKRTLEGLAARVTEERLDLECIVITGDVADKNSKDGYERLPDLLAPLVPQIVPPTRVVVLPGNHDVKKNTASSTPERYENFLAVRRHGYLTPLLEGVDIHDMGLAPAATPPVYVARDGSFMVVALNSANHSQVSVPSGEDLAPFLGELSELREKNQAVRALWDSWEQRGEHDPCWVDPAQLNFASDALREAASRAPHALRIAALHHQLLPVGTAAEIKTFETMTNLGEVLEWIGDNGVDVVLHGHKHVAHIAEAKTGPVVFGAPGADRRVLIVSSPNARPLADSSTAVARLLRVTPGAPRIAGVQVANLRTTGPGRTANLDWTLHVLDDDARHGIVRGPTAQDVHRKLMALGDNYYGSGRLLTCVIDEGASAMTLPETYPDAPVPTAQKDEWFQRTLDWWQRPEKGTAAAFNHGERLREFISPRGAENLDQLAHAVKALARKDYSSRAIAVLIDPTRDLLDPEGPAFPAFSLVQFAIRNDKLDVVGYFRKQEIPHWWPVNVGELARLQRHVAALLTEREITAGSITTITPQPVRGGSVPRVSVPSLDQRIDQPSGLLELVLPLFATMDAAGVELAQARWGAVFSDWEPQVAAPADGEPMPALGLEHLRTLIRQVAAVQGALPEHGALQDKLRILHAACQERLKLSTSNGLASDRQAWLTEWHTETDAILELVDRLLSPIEHVDGPTR